MRPETARDLEGWSILVLVGLLAGWLLWRFL